MLRSKMVLESQNGPYALEEANEVAVELCEKRKNGNGINLFLDFDFVEEPFWRRNLDPCDMNPAKMLTNILKFLAWFDGLSSNQRSTIERRDILKEFVTKFVHRMSIAEDEGVKSESETQEIFERRMRTPSGTPVAKRMKSNDRQLTENMFDALELANRFVEITKTENEALLICESELNQWHIALCNNVKDEAKARPGVPRSSGTNPIGSGKGHWYPPSEEIPEAFRMFTTIFSEIADSMNKKTQSGSVERLCETIKWAAWSLYTFLSIHPYSDGNGRTARLLANYVLSSIFPFPVSIYNVHAPSQRMDYIQAIKKTDKCRCQDEEEMRDATSSVCQTTHEIFKSGKPELLATMILESCWYSCQELYKSIKSQTPQILIESPFTWPPGTPGILLEQPKFIAQTAETENAHEPKMVASPKKE